jgi:hypothetical protein
MAAPVLHRAPLFVGDQQVLCSVRGARIVPRATSPGTIEAIPARGGPGPPGSAERDAHVARPAHPAGRPAPKPDERVPSRPGSCAGPCRAPAKRVSFPHRGRAGFAAARILEAGMIFTGIVSLLSLVTLRQHQGGAAGANAASRVTTGAAHVAIYKWTFLFGQSLMPGINALLLGSVMYRSRLVPRIIPVVGLIGAPLLIGTVIATLFGILKLGSPCSPQSRWRPGSAGLAGRAGQAGGPGLERPGTRRTSPTSSHSWSARTATGSTAR